MRLRSRLRTLSYTSPVLGLLNTPSTMNTLLTLCGESALVPTLADGNPNLPALVGAAAEILRCPARRISLTDVGGGAFMALATSCRVRCTILSIEYWIYLFHDGNIDCMFRPLSDTTQTIYDTIYTFLLHIDDLPPIPFHFIYYHGMFARVRTSEMEVVRLSKWMDDYHAFLTETPDMRWFISLEACLRDDLSVDEYDIDKRWLNTENRTALNMEPEIEEWIERSTTLFHRRAVVNQIRKYHYGAPIPVYDWIADLFGDLEDKEANIY